VIRAHQDAIYDFVYATRRINLWQSRRGPDAVKVFTRWACTFHTPVLVYVGWRVCGGSSLWGWYLAFFLAVLLCPLCIWRLTSIGQLCPWPTPITPRTNSVA